MLACHFFEVGCVISVGNKSRERPLPQTSLKASCFSVQYEQIFQKYYPLVRRQTAFMLNNSDAAEDVAQETFLQLYRSPPKDADNIGGWLSTVATNLACNYVRSETNRRRREEKAGSADEYASPEETVIRKEEVTLVRAVLEALDERSKTCLIMRHSGYSYAEIAAAVGVKTSSVGTIIARSQRRFETEYSSRRKECETNVL